MSTTIVTTTSGNLNWIGGVSTITINTHYWIDNTTGSIIALDEQRSNLFLMLSKLEIKSTPVKGMLLFTAPTWTTTASITLDPLPDDYGSSKKKSKGEKRAKRQEWKNIQSKHSRNTGRR